MRTTATAPQRTAQRPRRAAALAALTLAASLGTASALAASATVTPPRVTTGGVKHVHGSSGELDGVVDPNGLETSYLFEYGPTTAYGQKSKAVPIGHGTLSVKVGQTVTGLAPGWHYRIVAIAPNPEKPGTSFEVPGKDKSFVGGKSSKLKFDVAKGKENEILVAYNGTATVTGSLKGTGFAGKAVVLQGTPFPYTEAFVQLAGPVLSSRSGSFLFHVPHMKQNTEVRILTTDTRPAYSPSLTIHVAPAISLHERRLGGGRFRFYGTVAPATVKGFILIQQLLPQKAGSKKEGPRPHTVASAKITRAGKTFSRFSVVVTLTGNFRYRAFVRLPKGALFSGGSNHVLVKAPKSAATKREHGKHHKKK